MDHDNENRADQTVNKLEEGRKSFRVTWLVSALIAVSATLLIVAVGSVVAFGSIGRAIEYANGKRLSIAERTISLGKVSTNSHVDISFRLTNLGREPIQIIGSQADCSCLVQDERSFQIDGGATRNLTLNMELPASAGPIKRSVTVFTDVPTQEQVELSIVGEVVASASADPK